MNMKRFGDRNFNTNISNANSIQHNILLISKNIAGSGEIGIV